MEGTSGGGQATRRDLAVRAALFLVFFILYLGFGQALGRTGVFAHDDSIFQSDTARAVNDLTEPGANHYRTKVHPLFVLFFNPAGFVLKKVAGSPLLAASLLVAAAGGLSVVVAHAFFAAAGLGRTAAVSLAALLGFSTSHLVFASIPDTFIFTALSLALCAWLALARSGSLRAFVPAGVFSMGITTTNLAPALLLGAGGAWRAGGFREAVRKSAVALVAVLAATAGLSLVQKTLYPSTHLFFVPAAFQEDVGYTFLPGTVRQARVRALAVLGHVSVYGVVAPEPRVRAPKGSPVPWVTFHRKEAAARFGGTGRVALGLLLAAYGLAAWGIVRGRLFKEPAFLGLLLSVAFLALLHFFYGDDLFLYSCSWVVLVLATAGWGLAALSRTGRRWAAGVDLLLVSLAILTAVNNVGFLVSLLDLYRG